MRIVHHQFQIPVAINNPKCELLIDVTDDRGFTMAKFTAGAAAFESMREELTRTVLHELRESITQTLRTRLGIMVRDQMASGQRAAYNAGTHFAIVLSTADVLSIADELARNSSQALLGMIDCIEEG